MSTFLRLVITLTAFAFVACGDDKPKSAYAPVRTCADECEGQGNSRIIVGGVSNRSASSASDDDDESDAPAFDEPFFGSSGTSGGAGTGSFGISGVAGAGIPDPIAGSSGGG